MKEFERITLEIWADNGIRFGLRFTAEDCDKSCSFYGSLVELKDWLERGGVLADLTYQANAMMDHVAFYRLENLWGARTPEISGYHVVEFPYELRHKLAKALEYAAVMVACGAWRGEGYERGVTVDLTDTLHAGARYYGIDKGTVQVEYQNEEIEASVLRWRKSCPEFGQRFDQIVQIAKNSTSNSDGVAVATFSYDHAGFFWRAGSLIGGLINHGDEESPSWSIHT